MQAFKCDMCDNFFELKIEYPHFNVYYDTGDDGDYLLDLCPKCQEKLKKMLSNYIARKGF